MILAKIPGPLRRAAAVRRAGAAALAIEVAEFMEALGIAV